MSNFLSFCMVLGDAISKLETFVWIWNHSRSITWLLFNWRNTKLGQMTNLNVIFYMVVLNLKVANWIGNLWIKSSDKSLFSSLGHTTRVLKSRVKYQVRLQFHWGRNGSQLSVITPKQTLLFWPITLGRPNQSKREITLDTWVKIALLLHLTYFDQSQAKLLHGWQKVIPSFPIGWGWISRGVKTCSIHDNTNNSACFSCKLQKRKTKQKQKKHEQNVTFSGYYLLHSIPVYIFLFHLLIIYAWVYYEFSKQPVPRWLDSCVLHRYRRGHEFEPRPSLNVFRLSFRSWLSCVQNSDGLSLMVIHIRHFMYFVPVDTLSKQKCVGEYTAPSGMLFNVGRSATHSSCACVITCQARDILKFILAYPYFWMMCTKVHRLLFFPVSIELNNLSKWASRRTILISKEITPATKCKTTVAL